MSLKSPCDILFGVFNGAQVALNIASILKGRVMHQRCVDLVAKLVYFALRHNIRGNRVHLVAIAIISGCVDLRRSQNGKERTTGDVTVGHRITYAVGAIVAYLQRIAVLVVKHAAGMHHSTYLEE